MTPAEIIASPTAFNEWWQTRQPANQDEAIKKAAEDAGLIFTGNRGLIWLTANGRALRLRAHVPRLSARMRRAMAAEELYSWEERHGRSA